MCAWSRRKCKLFFFCLVKSLSASKNIKFISHMPWKWLMTDRFECNKSCPSCERECSLPVEKEKFDHSPTEASLDNLFLPDDLWFTARCTFKGHGQKSSFTTGAYLLCFECSSLRHSRSIIRRANKIAEI